MRTAYPGDSGSSLLQMRDPMEDFHSSKRARLDGDSPRGLDGDGPSESEILRLVAQRESMRQARRFAESDAIREELRSMGVELYDKEKEWRCRDGRRGMLFTAGPIECTLSDVDIQEMIREREEARKQRDWERADGLRDDLRSKGVELDDKEGLWRTSSGRSGTYSGMPASNINGATVRKLVAERERLRAAQDFDAADELRRQLGALGVEIFDNERLWRTADGQQGVIITGGHEVDCLLGDSEISSRVGQREEARSAKNWAQADSIRDELRSNGVELLDNQRVWCTTDGRHGSYSGLATPPPSAAPLGAVGAISRPNPLSTTPVGAAVGALPTVSSNMAAQVAAGLAALLAPQVQRQQQQQAASVVAPPAGPGSQALQGRMPSSAVTSTPSAQTFSTASIIALVAGREKAREKHDWEAADAIRADLRSHGVDVWDKEKLWRANDGRSGSMNRL
eukprot:CAMPEP_0175272072 /NCGR_PEP_ID=MMETSP0093-20121207/46238_1 /TAXON_ID=311494 /ORGANISM="Alexandrium monilatum, Strain CCMP3105" /LENGTH=452 /DNA_ID=CAMNT_0016566853 /DNA_START=1 /DNA_END=1359 /DNA_ORIENTATION=+